MNFETLTSIHLIFLPKQILYFLPETIEQHLLFVSTVHSAEIIVYIYKTNDFPYNVLMQRKHDESFVVQHILHHHSMYDLQYQESEEQISKQNNKINDKQENFLQKISIFRINLRHCIIYEGHLDYQTHPKII